MTQVREVAVATYLAKRQLALKRIVKQIRKELHISQGEVAAFLGCSRSRIAEIEQEDGPDYSVGELELLAVLFGKHPLDILRMAGQDAIEAGEMMTVKHTGKALLNVVDCELPRRIAKILTIHEMPGELIFSPTGRTMASIVDSFMAEDWQEEEPYQVTILCWDTQTGKITGQIRLPYAENVVPLESDHVAIATYQFLPEYQQTLEARGISHLLIWDTHSKKVEQKIHLPDQVQELAVSPNGRWLAAYMPASTTIQVWQTQDFQPVSAFELVAETHMRHPGAMLQTAVDYHELPRARKFTTMMFDYRASRFEFLNNDVLVVGFDEGVVELDVRPESSGYAPSPLGPRSDFPRVTHVRFEQHEVAVKTISYDYQPRAGDSIVRLHYEVPKENLYPPDAEVEVIRRLSGTIRQPVILDPECILAWVSYDTPYRWGRTYKARVGLVNLVSGRVVMLEDQGRHRLGDNQVYARIAPQGTMVAYWTFPYEGKPRLAIQYIDTAPLRDERVTLQTELEKERGRRAEEDTYIRSLEEKTIHDET